MECRREQNRLTFRHADHRKFGSEKPEIRCLCRLAVSTFSSQFLQVFFATHAAMPIALPMNILLTNVALPQDREYLSLIDDWKKRRHLVETMPHERVEGYLRWELASSFAAIDAIVCYAQMPHDMDDYFILNRANKLATAAEQLPESCTMYDGRKWRSIPFIIIAENPYYYFGPLDSAPTSHAKIVPPNPYYPDVVLSQIQEEVDRYVNRILDDYMSLGIVVRFNRGHAQIGPALRKKRPDVESAYYYASADRRRNRRWMTIMRDNQGLKADVELFQELLDRKASETEMQHFFEEHPSFLMEARMGLPIAHPRYAVPKRWAADFAITSILGPQDPGDVELLELKGPAEQLMNQEKIHRGFSTKVHKAVDQVRDYGRMMKNPANVQKMIRQFGYLPDNPKFAVLIGRNPEDEFSKGWRAQRQKELDVKVINYDEILQPQVDQLSRIDVQSRFMMPPLRLSARQHLRLPFSSQD